MSWPACEAAPMLSERDIDLAHPDAFDFVFGTLPSGNAVWFGRHLDGCSSCQKVIDEYGGIGRIVQDLPPHVEPPAGLEDRVVAAMVAALAEQKAQGNHRSQGEDQTATRVYPKPEPGPAAGVRHSAEPETRLYMRPQFQPPAEPQDPPMVTRLPVWRRPRRLGAAAALAAAVVIAAAIVLPRIGASGAPAQVTVVIPLHATTAANLDGNGAAGGRATAQPAGPSWTYVLSVHGLKVLPGNEVYECWYAASGSTKLHPLLVSGGTFVVDNSGSTTVTMTAGVDPRQFRTMEITVESPGNGALTGTVLLTGQATS
jgi:Anti-sigma-K factor rskA